MVCAYSYHQIYQVTVRQSKKKRALNSSSLRLHDDSGDGPENAPIRNTRRTPRERKTPFFIGRTQFCTTNLGIWQFFGHETYIQFVAHYQDFFYFFHFFIKKSRNRRSKFDTQNIYMYKLDITIH